MSTQKTVSIKEMLKPGVQAVLSLWKPILLIQIFALVFVFFFYRTPELQRMPEAINHLKTQWGVGWTLLTVWTSSIAISEVAAKLTTKGRQWMPLRTLVPCLFYFGLIGILLDLFYGQLNTMLGSGTDIVSVIKKIAVDQFILSPFVTMPLATTFFAWRDYNFDMVKTKAGLSHGKFWERYFAMLGTCWMFFGPFTIALYNLPIGLQFPMAMAAQAAWSLIVVVVAAQGSKS